MEENETMCAETGPAELAEAQLVDRIEGRAPSDCVTEHDLEELEAFGVVDRP
jgi:hypothetical protein